jgi:putative GTP pyrophosphokinase
VEENAIKSIYAANLDRYRRLSEEAQYVLKTELARNKIKIHDLSGRVKALDSMVEKCVRKDYKSPFEEMNDIVGIRIVCLFLSDVKRISELVYKSFDVLEADDKIDGLDVATFGYMSAHYVAKMHARYAGPRYADLEELKFEVQIRTIAMHAWALVSHYLDYKTQTDIPKDLRRDFYALSGLFYVADSHFELFYGASQRSREKAELAFASKQVNVDQALDLDVMTAYLRDRFSDRNLSSRDNVSGLLSDLSEYGIKTISQLHSMLDRTQIAFGAYEQKYPPSCHFRFRAGRTVHWGRSSSHITYNP